MTGSLSFGLLPIASFDGWLDDADIIVLEAQDGGGLDTCYRLNIV